MKLKFNISQTDLLRNKQMNQISTVRDDLSGLCCHFHSLLCF